MRQVTTTTIVTPATGSETIEGLATANPLDLTVLETVKQELRIPDADTTQDTWIGSAIQRVSARIQTYLDRTIALQTYQDIVWLQSDDYPYQVPGRTAPLQVRQWPITSVTSVVVTEGALVTVSLIAGTDFILDAEFGQLIRLNVWTNFPTNWDAAPTTVIYQAGYATIPADLEEATLRVIAESYQSRARDPLLKVNEQPGLGRQEWWIPNARETQFAPEIAEVLNKYRIPVIQ